jgi:hypothetical protein
MVGYTMWGFVHVLYLVGWGNRLVRWPQTFTGSVMLL